LKQRQVSEYNIRKALKEIDEEQYQEVLNKLAKDKYAGLKTEQWMVRKKKTMDYLLQKGYEPEFINQAMQELSADNSK